MKRIALVILLAALLCCCAASAEWTPPALTLNTTQHVTVPPDWGLDVYTFTPSVSGGYLFCLSNSTDYAYIKITHDGGTLTNGSVEQGGTEVVAISLDANVKYFVQCGGNENGATFDLIIKQASVSSDFEYADIGGGKAMLTKYKGTATDLTIPTKIGAENLDVVKISRLAFSECDSLVTVTMPELPEGVLDVASGAFWKCDNLTTITISSTASLNEAAVSDCPKLLNFIVGENNPYHSVEGGVLFNKNMTTLYCYPTGKTSASYTVPTSVKRIGMEAFYNVDSLKSITLSNVENIGWCALYGTSLTSLEIPASLTELIQGMFMGLEGLTSITVAEGNNKFIMANGSLYYSLGNEGVSLVKFLSGGATADLSETLVNNKPIIEVEMHAFEGRANLTDVTLPNAVYYYDGDVFVNCPSLASVTFPIVVESIPGSFAAKGCGAFTKVRGFRDTEAESYAKRTGKTFESIGESIPTMVIGTQYRITEHGSVRMAFVAPKTDYYTFQASAGAPDCWPDASLYDSEGNDIAFSNDTYGGYAFVLTHNLVEGERYILNCSCYSPSTDYNVEVVIPSQTDDYIYSVDPGNRVVIIKYKGDGGAVEVPENIDGYPVFRIADVAFSGDPSITSISLPEGLNEISGYTITGLSNLTSISLPATLERMGGGFYECPKLRTITLASGNTSFVLDENGILYSTDMQTLHCIPPAMDISVYTAPTSLVYVENYAIYSNPNLTKVDLAPAVRLWYLEENPIGLSNLEYISFPEQFDNFRENVLLDCGDAFTVYGYEGSAAQDFASSNHYPFSSLGPASSTPAVDGRNTVQAGYTKFSFTPPSTSFYHIYSDKENELWGEQCTVKDNTGKILAEDGYGGDGGFDIFVEFEQGVTYTILCECKDPESYYMYLDKVGGEKTPDGLVLMINDSNTYTVRAYEGEGLEVIIPKNYNGIEITELGDRLFENSPITKLSIPGTVKEIGYNKTLCDNCPDLSVLEFGEGTEYLESGSFWKCPSLTSVTLPSTMDLGGNPFADCVNLTTVTLAGNNPNIGSDENGVIFSKPYWEDDPEDGEWYGVLIYPAGKTAKTYTVPEGVRIINDFAFTGASNLEEVILPSTLESIFHTGFSYTGIRQMAIPSKTDSVDFAAFRGCRNMTALAIKNMECRVDSEVFDDSPDAYLYCYSGSRAHIDALDGNIPFKLIDKGAVLTEDTTAKRVVEVKTKLGTELAGQNASLEHFTQAILDMNGDDKLTMVDAVMLLQQTDDTQGGEG